MAQKGGDCGVVTDQTDDGYGVVTNDSDGCGVVTNDGGDDCGGVTDDRNLNPGFSQLNWGIVL